MATPKKLTHVTLMSTYEEDQQLTAWNGNYRTLKGEYRPCFWFEYKRHRFTPFYDRETNQEYAPVDIDRLKTLSGPLAAHLKEFAEAIHAEQRRAHPCVLLRVPLARVLH